ncbi:unnamed protein product [Urochloa humidicola]
MRGGDGGDVAAAGAGSSARPAHAYPMGRGATEPSSARGGHWDAARRIQPAVAARSRLPVPWPSSTASLKSQQMQLRASRPDASPGAMRQFSCPFPPCSTSITKQGLHHLGQL